MLRWFTFHWCDGDVETLPGESPENAFRRAGYEPVQIYAVDYFTEDSDPSDEFVTSIADEERA